LKASKTSPIAKKDSICGGLVYPLETGMGKIGASYKYLRKSMDEVRYDFFGNPSGKIGSFTSSQINLKTLPYQ